MKKYLYNRVMASILLLLMLINIINPAVVFAKDGNNQGTSIETQENIDSKYPINILKKAKMFDELCKSDKSEICNYFDVKDTYMLDCCKNGYTILDSITIINFSKKYSISVKNMILIMKNYKNIDEASIELDKSFTFIKDENISGQRKKEIVNLLIKGYKYINIYNAYYFAKSTNMPIETFIIKNNGSNIIKGDNGQQQNILNALSEIIDAQAVANYCNINKINLEAFVNSVYNKMNVKEDENKSNAPSIDKSINLVSNTITSSSTSKDNKLDLYINPYYSIAKNGKETISPCNGELRYEDSDFKLSGRNGMNLNITTRYLSNQAKLYEEVYKSNCYTVTLGYDKLCILNDGTTYNNGFEKQDEFSMSNKDEADEELNEYLNTHSIEYGDYISRDLYEVTIQITEINSSTKRTVQLGKYLTREQAEKAISDYKLQHPDVCKVVGKGEDAESICTETEGIITINKYLARDAMKYTGNVTQQSTPVWSVLKKSYLENVNNIGVGWYFGFSSIDVDQGGNGNCGTLYLSNGEKYPFNLGLANMKPAYIFKTIFDDYKLKDMSLEKDSGSFSNGQMTSSYVLTFKNKYKEYFGSDGRLLGEQDRYKNTITFNHILINNYPVISKITDTIGRNIFFTYSDSGSEKEVAISAPGGKNIKYILEQAPGYTGRYVLVKKIDENNKETLFHYSFDKTDVQNSKKYSNLYANLTKITYPTNAATEYTYGKAYADAKLQVFRITSRQEVTKDLSTNLDTVYNKEDYAYEGIYTGYPDFYNKGFSFDNFTYKTIVTNSKNVTSVFTFDKNNLLVDKQIKAGNRLLRDVSYSYIENMLPISETTSYYNSIGQVRKTTTSSSYNEYGDVTEEKDELGYKTSYTYDDDFHQITSITKDIDSTSKEITNNIIDKTTGSISRTTEKHIDNGIDKSIIKDYQYDSYGNLISESTPLDNGKIQTIRYEYSPEYNGAYLTRKSINVTDYKGTVNTINQEYGYDFNTGNMLWNIDGNNNKTTYSYDILDRVTGVKNPDNTLKTIVYDDASNIVTATDEKGYSIKGIFDGLGRMVEKQELRNGAWITLKRMHYNTTGETDYIDDAKGNRTYFQYDELNRNTSVKNPDSTMQSIVYDDVLNNKIVYNEENEPREYVYNNRNELIEYNVFPSKNNLNNKYKTIYVYNGIGKVIQKTNTNGTSWFYTYDDLGRLIGLMSALSQNTHYSYDNLNNLIKIIKPKGTIVLKEYDETGRLIKQTDPSGKAQYIKYDGNSNIIESVDRLGRIKKCNYDSRDREIADYAGSNSILYSYDDQNNIATINDNGKITVLRYNPDDSLKSKTFPDGKVISWEYDLNGNKGKQIDIFGKITVYGYDSLDRLKTVTIDGRTTTYNYNFDGTRQSVIYPNNITETYLYNDLNQVTYVANKKPSATINWYSYTYDNSGNQIEKATEKGAYYYTYDILNRVKSVEYPDGKVVSYEKYDANSNIEKVVILNSSGNILASKEYQYNELDQLKKIIKSYNNPIKTLKITSSKDKMAEGESGEFSLSGLQEDNSIIPDDVLNKAVWTCNLTEFKLSSTTGKSITGIMTSDAWKRVKTGENVVITAKIDNISVSATISKKVQLQNIMILSSGNLKMQTGQSVVLTASGVMNDGTSASDEVLNKTIWTSNVPELGFSTAAGKCVTVTMSNAAYNKLGTTGVATITVQNDGKTCKTLITTTASDKQISELTITPDNNYIYNGNKVVLTLSGKYANGTAVEDGTLNKAVWEVNKGCLKLTSSVGKIVEGTYTTPDPSKGNLTTTNTLTKVPVPGKPIYVEIKVTAKIGSASGSTTVYGFVSNSNIQNSLQGITEADSTNEDNYAEIKTYDYDSALNPKENNINNIAPMSITANALASSGTNADVVDFTYDNEGNLISKSINGKEAASYTYDEYDQLISYKDNKNSITAYSYYPDGLRATKTNQGKTTTYYTDDENVITETENGNLTATNIYGINPIARQDASGKTYYYLYNAHGDVVALSDEASGIINTYDYDIYGNSEETKESVSNPIRYAGEYQDNESGLYYLRARYYDSDTMRFISEDTDDGKIEDPLSLNLYTYCEDNPIIYVDPTGHETNSVTTFVNDYDGSISYGRKVIGWRVTMTGERGRTTGFYGGYNKPVFMTDVDTTVVYKPVYEDYADITIGDKTKRFSGYNKKNIGKLKMDRVAFLRRMGFNPVVMKPFTKNVSKFQAEADWWINASSNGAAGGILAKVLSCNEIGSVAVGIVLSKLTSVDSLQSGKYTYNVIKVKVGYYNYYTMNIVAPNGARVIYTENDDAWSGQQ